MEECEVAEPAAMVEGLVAAHQAKEAGGEMAPVAWAKEEEDLVAG